MTPASVREAVIKVRSEPQGAIGSPGSGAQQQRRLRQAVSAWLTIASHTRQVSTKRRSPQISTTDRRSSSFFGSTASMICPSPQIFGNANRLLVIVRGVHVYPPSSKRQERIKTGRGRRRLVLSASPRRRCFLEPHISLVFDSVA